MFDFEIRKKSKECQNETNRKTQLLSIEYKNNSKIVKKTK